MQGEVAGVATQGGRLEIRGLTKWFGGLRALHEVSFDVEPNIGMRIIPITKAKA